jgi:predicted acylesterase/phospholipase RssA
MLDVALATSAAPTYFPPAEVKHGSSSSRYLDGGVGANMPVLIAVLHAVHYLGVLPSQIDVLSIGTTTVAKGYARIPQGVKDWMFKGKIVDLYSNAQESFMEEGRDMILHPEQFLHIDSQVNGGDFSLDGLKNVAQLISRGESTIRKESIAARIRSKFINGVPAADWKTLRK